jgi:selenium-binding protein 1
MSESAGTHHDGMPSVAMDPTFYRSAAEAAAAPTEKLAYVVAFDRAGERPDALSVIDVDESSDTFATVVGWAELPTRGDELHHFGWNACSSALMHAGHDMGADGRSLGSWPLSDGGRTGEDDALSTVVRRRTLTS